MKSITILGGLGKDPVAREHNGQKVTSFSVGVNDGWGDKRRTMWFDCSMWGKRGEVIANNLRKGDKISVTGELSDREYEGKTYLTIRAYDFTFVGGKGSSTPASQEQPSQNTANGLPEDEIPF